MSNNFPLSEKLKERLLSIEMANDLIGQAIRNETPFLAGRFGSFEGRICARRLFNHGNFPPFLRRSAAINAGICNVSKPVLNKFSMEYLAAACSADLLAIFDFDHQEPLAEFTDNKNVTMLSSLNPMNIYHRGVTPWTLSLDGKRLLLVHPFATSARAQFNRKDKVPFLRHIFANTSLVTIEPPNTAGSMDRKPKEWSEYLDETKALIGNTEFDVALIGAGAYGLPLGAFVKSLGKVAVHAGGATQLYFGVRGARWDKFFSRYGIDEGGWVRPLSEETPSFSQNIEGGCYW